MERVTYWLLCNRREVLCLPLHHSRDLRESMDVISCSETGSGEMLGGHQSPMNHDKPKIPKAGRLILNQSNSAHSLNQIGPDTHDQEYHARPTATSSRPSGVLCFEARKRSQAGLRKKPTSKSVDSGMLTLAWRARLPFHIYESRASKNHDE